MNTNLRNLCMDFSEYFPSYKELPSQILNRQYHEKQTGSSKTVTGASLQDSTVSLAFRHTDKPQIVRWRHVQQY